MKLRLLFSTLLCSFLLAGLIQAQSVGLIGTATPGGWDVDTNMVQSLDSAHLWTMVINLNEGEAKFRLNDNWDVNWGFNTFPTGLGIQGGPNIPIPAAGEYTINFNSNTGDYKFVYTSDIGIIGDATPGGWNDDTNMYHDPLDTNKYFIKIDLVQGSVKFRANDNWDVNWGSTAFPTGVGTQGGENIPIAVAGKYRIDFDKSTGAYSFVEVLEFNTISLVGDGTPGGWDVDTDLTKDSGNPNLWKGNVTLVDGFAKFRANHAWAISWGDTLFPSGIGILNGSNIPVVAGDYLVTFNTQTLEYNFLPVVHYQTVGLIGDAIAGWDVDVDMVQDPANFEIWRLRLSSPGGEAKFRAENDWAVNWGAGEFPEGVGVQEGANIPVPAGEYNVTFNSTTGAYKFEVLVVYAYVGMVGTATPLASWDVDIDMTKDATDESLWTISSVDMVDGKAKFRVDHAWAINWGSLGWPTGNGTQDGPDIPVTAGTYKVSINTGSGAYAFLPPSSGTTEQLSINSITIAPNPVADFLNIAISADELKGDATVIILNNLGQVVMTQNLNIQDRASINVATLTPGNYFVQIANGKYTVGKPIVVVK
jgi:hypothetical protein